MTDLAPQTAEQIREAVKAKTNLLHVKIDDDFAFHPAATAEKRNEHTSVRSHCKELAHFIADNVPPGRERSLALTKVEEAMHWANAGIAKEGPVE